VQPHNHSTPNEGSADRSKDQNIYKDNLLSEHRLSLPTNKHAIVIALRENGIYEQLIPIAREWSAEFARSLKIITVPRGSSQQVIMQKIDENASAIKGSFVIADRTFMNKLEPLLGDEAGRCLLDNVFYAATICMLEKQSGIKLGRPDFFVQSKSSTQNSAEQLHSCGQIISRLFGLALKHGHPKEVFIFSPHLDDHHPFCLKPVANNPAKHIKNWLVAAGLEEDCISILDGFDQLKELNFQSLNDYWFIGGRHYLFGQSLYEALLEKYGREEADDWPDLLDDPDYFEKGAASQPPEEDDRTWAEELYVRGFESEKEVEMYEEEEEEEFPLLRASFLCGTGFGNQEEIELTRGDFLAEHIRNAKILRFPAENLVPDLVESGLVDPSDFAGSSMVSLFALSIVLEQLSGLEKDCQE